MREMPNASDPLIGQVVCDKYEIRGVLGAGSMGVVYHARHTTLGKDVAIKVLRRRLVSDKNVVRRFKQEARAASRLNHPNTIQILDFGELDDGELFMAMEYVDGRDMALLIQQEGPLPPARLAHIVTQVCSALYEAHDNGIVHRDLKPANVLVANLRSQRDFVKVLDFGIAKMLDPDPSQSIPMTRDGFVCGTPAFMSPEQVQGFDLDGRSDLFALGVCMYQALTGKLPFIAPTPLELATALVTEDPVHPSEARPEWSPDPLLSEVCLRALAKKPEDRYGSALAVIDALAPMRSDSSRALLPAFSDPGDPGEDADPAQGVATQPNLPAASDELQTKRRTPALTPANTPNRAHLELPQAERRPNIADELQTVEIARLPVRQRRRRHQRLALLAGAALAGFVVVTLVLDRFIPAPAGDPARVIKPTPVAVAAPSQAPPPPLVEPPTPSLPAGPTPRVVGVLAEPARSPARSPARARRAKRSRRKRGKEGTAGTMASPEPAPPPPAEPPQETVREQARRMHALASKALRSGDHKGALRQLRAAVALDPGYAPLHRELGKLYMRSRDRKKGVAHFRKYVELAPTASDTKVYREIIRQSQ